LHAALDLRRIEEALDLSVRVLARHPQELAAQLIGRLSGFNRPALEPLLGKAGAWKGAPWLRPLTSCLTPPGGGLRHLLTGHVAPVNAVAVSRSGKTAISASNDGTLRVWDLHTAELLHRWTPHEDYEELLQASRSDEPWMMDAFLAVAITPDERYAVVGGWEEFVIWDLEDGTPGQRSSALRPVFAVAVSQDSKVAVAGGGGLNQAILTIWDLERGEERLSLTGVGHTGGIRTVALSGHRLLTGSLDNTARVWDIATGAEEQTLKHAAPVLAVCLVSEGRTAITASNELVRTWDVATGSETGPALSHPSVVRSATVNPGGHTLVVGTEDGTVHLWDLARREVVQVLSGHSGAVTAVAFATEERLVSGSADATVRLWDLTRTAPIAARPGHDGRVHAVAFAADGRHAASGGEDMTVRVWATDPPRELRILRGHRGPVTAIAFGAGDSRIVSGSRDGSLMLWDLESGEHRGALLGHTDAITAIAGTPHGPFALSASRDNTVRVWDLERVEPVATLDVRSYVRAGSTWGGGVGGLAILPDGRLVTCSHDREVQLWDLYGATCLAQYHAGVPVGRRDHFQGIQCLALTPDGSRAISCGEDETFRIWDLTASPHDQPSYYGHGAGRIVPIAEGRLFVTTAKSGEVKVCNTKTLKTVALFSMDSALSACAVSPSSALVVVGDTAGGVHFLRPLKLPAAGRATRATSP